MVTGIVPPDGEPAVPEPVRLTRRHWSLICSTRVGPGASNLVLLDSGDGDSVGVHHLGHGPLMDLPERVQLRLALPFEGFKVKL